MYACELARTEAFLYVFVRAKVTMDTLDLALNACNMEILALGFIAMHIHIHHHLHVHSFAMHTYKAINQRSISMSALIALMGICVYMLRSNLPLYIICTKKILKYL